RHCSSWGLDSCPKGEGPSLARRAVWLPMITATYGRNTAPTRKIQTLQCSNTNAVMNAMMKHKVRIAIWIAYRFSRDHVASLRDSDAEVMEKTSSSLGTPLLYARW